MNAMYAIGWFIAAVISTVIVFQVIGFSGIVRVFPEGKRWWHLPAQLGSLAFFAAVVLLHPFGGA